MNASSRKHIDEILPCSRGTEKRRKQGGEGRETEGKVGSAGSGRAARRRSSYALEKRNECRFNVLARVPRHSTCPPFAKS